MKVKTSVTLSEELVGRLDKLTSHYGTRSAIIEQAILAFIAAHERKQRDARDLDIINRRADALNAEASDVLSYQVEL